MSDLMQGYRALHTNSAWYDVSNRGRIRVAGEDRARLLHAMTTNQVNELKPGEGNYVFFLSAQGRILADSVILCREDHFLLDTEPETHTKILEHLDKFIIADDVTLEDVRESTICLEIEGPQAEGHLRSLGVLPPETDFSSVEWAGSLVYRLDGERFRIIAASENRETLVARLGEEASLEAARIVRMERAIPRYGEDITERHLIQETRQIQAVSFSKGCYIGQEIVERVRSRGAVHKGLASVEISATEPVLAGTEIHDESGAKCGEMMSSVYSPALQKVIGFAYLRTDQLGAGAKPMNIEGKAVSVRQG